MAGKIKKTRAWTEHLISTTPTERRCQRCRAATLTGLDQGVPFRVEPGRLAEPPGEATAIMAGLVTYELVGGALVRRDLDRIVAGWPKIGVYVEHRCRAVRCR